MHGGNEERVRKDAERFKQPLPKFIQDKPKLLPGLDLYYTGLWDLNSTRSMTTGVAGPIPWDVIQLYAKENNFSKEQTEDLHYHISMLDPIIMGHINKRKT